MDTRDHLALYSVNCKKCGHLDPAESKKWSSCHHTKGNPYCPAKEVQIVVVGKAYRLAEQIKKARNARDAVSEARILAFVVTQTEAFKERFYSAIETTPETPE